MFRPGKITVVGDSGAGSSAKGLRSANIWKHHRASHTTFAVNTFLSNAAHTVILENGQSYIYQCLSSISMLDYEKQYIAPGATFAESEILREIEDHNLTPDKLGIHPQVAIVTQKDIDYEKGLCDFEGNPKEQQESINLRIGSTLHGVGAARARRILRRPDAVLARDLPSLKPFLCDTAEEILVRLRKGESGLGEIAQGWQLSLFLKYYPKCTSRNCSVAAFLDDAMLPPVVLGPFVANFRTFPIRVNSNKYVRKSDKKILTWDEWEATPEDNRVLIAGDSGGCYDDQLETTWEEISKNAGETIVEQTSLTRLPRRVYSFSRNNLVESIIHNNTGDDIYISVNFMNYVDASVKGKSDNSVLTNKVKSWLDYNINPGIIELSKHNIHIKGMFIGTWKTIDDTFFMQYE